MPTPPLSEPLVDFVYEQRTIRFPFSHFEEVNTIEDGGRGEKLVSAEVTATPVATTDEISLMSSPPASDLIIDNVVHTDTVAQARIKGTAVGMWFLQCLATTDGGSTLIVKLLWELK